MPQIDKPLQPEVLLHCWSLVRDVLGRKIDLLELPDLAAKFGFKGVEWLDRLMPSFDPVYWDELNAAQNQAGLKTAAFSLSMDLSAGPQAVAAQKDRAQAIISLCPRLGVKALRVSIGGHGPVSLARLILFTQKGGDREGEPEALSCLGRGLYKLMLRLPRKPRHAGHRADPLALQSAAWSLQPLSRQAANLGIIMGVENHFGLTSHPEDLLALLDLVAGDPANRTGHGNQNAGWAERSPMSGSGLGVCLDTGNHPVELDPAVAARLLAPHAVHVHWKIKSDPPTKDELQVLAFHANALKAAGFSGLISVEYEGPGYGLTGAKAGLDLLNKFMR